MVGYVTAVDTQTMSVGNTMKRNSHSHQLSTQPTAARIRLRIDLNCSVLRYQQHERPHATTPANFGPRVTVKFEFESRVEGGEESRTLQTLLPCSFPDDLEFETEMPTGGSMLMLVVCDEYNRELAAWFYCNNVVKLTGVPLNVSIRLQLNLYMKKVSGITETGKISEVVMPMIWFEESGYIDGPILTTFHTNLVVLPAIMEYMQYGFIALGLATIVIAALVYRRVKAADKEPVNGSHDHERKEKYIVNNSENVKNKLLSDGFWECFVLYRQRLVLDQVFACLNILVSVRLRQISKLIKMQVKVIANSQTST
ncbi:Scavenger receptor class B member 1 [Collichthys lucidus]|uniref:Scavenger receptor class B member 1 n=1 Tax=Collichthys lucidus TaxID=240159 RepID=A0A4U5VB40_COLLU|nr:Scavenger receptor class B member 1 [Collichthys lucidus]